MLRLLILIFLALLAGGTAIAQELRLTRITHIYGIVPDPADRTKVLLATERGLLRASPEGTAELVSAEAGPVQAFTSLDDGRLLMATAGEREGARISRDLGKTWTRVAAEGALPGPFLVLAGSPADANVVYGAAGGVLYRSADGGRAWTDLGPAPAPVVDIAGAARDRDVVYLGTARGLFRSTDGGRTWATVDGANRATSLVATLRDNETYAFITNVGLVRLSADGRQWTPVAPANDFDGALLHLVAQPDASRVYAVTQFMKILVSSDRGRTWAPFNR